ncbi:hypothetical protein EJF18_60153 [Clavispora lusitaniae]|uniref:Uncharacterized protein n=1 Tax=Clavispora lusitaniae TaxID=36911 RepID=A0ACD0WQ14_CLALS|nr:hypothetical protein EJF14_60153 [Clavispora lusitaniae]QFZ35292.1 hypothetical protein EJF16_60153 [Clavispora lusitaniae]QFZ40986.1 hypothetical protein EJF15_60153 [Clavispora lusitaniae]QFZ46667.1 hypothetical protein EJF18_60153 [Clavispora lusitaniae]QFZ52332.1 hypothetical protein EJF17_60153 [Clavispora lusitaniae]
MPLLGLSLFLALLGIFSGSLLVFLFFFILLFLLCILVFLFLLLLLFFLLLLFLLLLFLVRLFNQLVLIRFLFRSLERSVSFLLASFGNFCSFGPLLSQLLQMFFTLTQEVLTTLNSQINLSRSLCWWEWSVNLLLLLDGSLLTCNVLLLEHGQESRPVLVGQLRVLSQLSLDHQFLDVIDGVHVLHAILHHSSDLLQSLVWAHGTDSVTLHQNVTFREQLQCLQSVTVWTDQPLSSLGETLLVADKVADFDHIARNVILQNLHRLRERHRSGQKLDQVPRFQNHSWVECFSGCFHSHRAFHQVQSARNSMTL